MQKLKPTASPAEPYLFVCYAHADAEAVQDELRRIDELGYAFFYDDGIAPGESWTEELARAIDGAFMLLFFATPSSVNSRNCLNEIQYALSHDTAVLAVHLEPTELPGGLELSLGTSQAILRHRLDESAYAEKLQQALERRLHPLHPAETLARGRREHALPRRGLIIGLVAGALGLLVGLGYLVADLYGPVTPPSVAVLPFADRTGDSGAISYGIAEELLNLLARTPDLRVIASALAHDVGPDADLSNAAASLQTDYIVHGSLQRSDEQLRLRARLIDADTGALVWSAEFQGDLSDVFSAQRQIALNVARALEVAVAFASDSPLSPLNPKAVDYYLQGQAQLRNSSALESAVEAQALFRRSLEVQPGFPPGLAGLCRAKLKVFVRTEDPADFASAESACLDVLAQDDASVQSRVSLATLYNRSGNFEQAEATLNDAARRSPHFEPIYYQMALTYEGLGRMGAAEQAYRRSLALEPGYWGVYLGYGNFLALNQRYEEAVEQYTKITELAPGEFVGYASLGATYSEMGRYDLALRELERSLEIAQSSRTYFNLGMTHMRLGNNEAWRDAMIRAVELNPQNHRALTFLAIAYERTGADELAIDARRRALDVANQLVAINPADALVLSQTAALLLHEGETEEAVRRAERALDLDPEDAKVHYNAAIVYRAAGDRQRSIEMMRKALKLGYSPALFDSTPEAKPFLEDEEIRRLLDAQ